MANITSNLIDQVVTPAQGTAVQGALTLINTTLAGVFRSLTDEERLSLFSLNVNNKVFVEEAIEEIGLHTTLLPAAVSLSQMQNDLELFEQLGSMETQLVDILNKVRDTKRRAGHEAYAMGLTGYTIFKALAASGVDEAKQPADRLGERFATSGGAAPEPPVTP